MFHEMCCSCSSSNITNLLWSHPTRATQKTLRGLWLFPLELKNNKIALNNVQMDY